MPYKFCSLVFALALPVCSQVIDTSKLPAPVVAADGHINLDVIVRDKAGKPAAGLAQRDFTVTDDKLPVALTSFQAMKPEDPVEVILLIDNVNSPFAQTAQMRDQVKKFLGRNGGKLEQPVSLIFLSDSGASELPPTRDGAYLVTAIDQAPTALRTIGRSQGFYGAVDRFQMSMRALVGIAETEGKRPGRKMLLWIGPGWPLLSGPNVQLTQKEQKDLFNSITATSTLLRQSRVVLYSIDPIGVIDAGTIRTTWYKDFLKGVKNSKGVEAGDLALQVLAEQSGGRVMNSGNDIVSELATCVSDVQSWYVLSFDAPKADVANEYHALDVKVDKPGLVVRTRTGYYAQP